MWAVLKWAVLSCWDEGIDLEMDPNCWRSTWPPLAATQAVKRLVKFATDLLMCYCSCGSSSQMVCKATFNSSIVLGFSWSLWYLSSLAVQTWQSSRFKYGEFVASDYSQWTQDKFACSQSCVTRTVWVEAPSCWKMKPWLLVWLQCQ